MVAFPGPGGCVVGLSVECVEVGIVSELVRGKGLEDSDDAAVILGMSA
jgi:hypothetical protein